MTREKGGKVQVSAPAKVNLFLRVLAREDSGFHQLETLFCALEFEDSLSVELRGNGISLETDGPNLGPPEENLVYRAARGFLARANQDIGVEIRLTKRIPPQGGLGGGSSDAAATLRALRALLPGLVEEESLLNLAGELGSDVPFFLSPSPLALAWGRGDRVLPLPPLPRAPVLLAFPPFGVATPEAYRALAEERSGRPSSLSSGLLRPTDLTDWRRIGALARNDFEGPVFGLAPILRRIQEALAAQSPILSLLSGSGSALFAVFEREDSASEAVESLKGSFPETSFILTHTRTEAPDPT